ncbi:MAG: hypothetical protein ACYC1A_01955 [Spirochaetales bacterium]
MKKAKTAIIVMVIGMVCAMPVIAATDGEGGEVPLVKYSNATLGYSISYPQTWMKDSGFANGLKFTGGDNAMTVEIVPTAAGVDLLALAKADAGLASYYPGAQTVGIAISKEVRGAVVRGFTAKGKSLVTGKPFDIRGDRYYLALGAGKVVIITVGGPTRLYDREGIRDIALTFRAAK